MLHEMIRNYDFWRNTALQHCCEIVSNSYNIVTLRCAKNRRCLLCNITLRNAFRTERRRENFAPGDFHCWFSHDVTKIQTKKLSILPRFYFHDALEHLKLTNFRTNFRFKRALGFVIEYAWISKLLRDALFTWRPRELSCRSQKWLISGNFAI